MTGKSKLSPAENLSAIIIGLALGFGIHTGFVWLVLWGIESLSEWRCPNFWAFNIMIWIGFNIVTNLIKAGRSK